MTYSATGPICAPLLPEVFNSDRPAAKRKMHIPGKVLLGNSSAWSSHQARTNSQAKLKFFGPWYLSGKE